MDLVAAADVGWQLAKVASGIHWKGRIGEMLDVGGGGRATLPEGAVVHIGGGGRHCIATHAIIIDRAPPA